MKRLLPALAFFAALYVTACGGSSSSNNTPPPALGFSNASLNGQFAFEMSGSDLNGNLIARIGSFTANGSGSITAAVEDVSDAGTASQAVQFSGGTYSIGSDGRGTLTLNGGTLGSGLGLNIAMSSTSGGVMVQTDGNATSSGSFDIQMPSAFSLTSITGQYAFDLAGVDLTAVAAPLAIAGEFAVSAGNITGGEMDINSGRNAGPVGPTTIGAASFALDNTFGPSAGRGMVTINGQVLAFYIVDGTRLRFLEEDAAASTSGDAFVQNTIPTSVANLNGNFAFISAGAAVLGNNGSVARAGSVGFNGAGATSNALLDDNNSGSHSAIGPDAGTYTLENTGSGRGTFSFVDSGKGTFSYIFYLFSPSQGLLLETSNGLIAAGTMSAQSSVSNSSLAGNYVFNWSGVTGASASNVGFEEDFIGQYVDSSSGSLSGTSDFAELGSTSSRGPIFTGVPLTGMFNATGGTGRNTYQVTVNPGNGAPSTTINFAAYVASGNTVYVVTTDSNRVTSGSAVTQTVP